MSIPPVFPADRSHNTGHFKHDWGGDGDEKGELGMLYRWGSHRWGGGSFWLAEAVIAQNIYPPRRQMRTGLAQSSANIAELGEGGDTGGARKKSGRPSN